jgi:hypothetical protein
VFTLVPRGPLADGSPASTLTYEREFDPGSPWLVNPHLADIPLAIYTLTGEEVLPDGRRRPLLMKTGFASFADALEIAFPTNAHRDPWPGMLGFTRTP